MEFTFSLANGTVLSFVMLTFPIFLLYPFFLDCDVLVTFFFQRDCGYVEEYCPSLESEAVK
jgi:hypothetical protein